MNWLKNRKLRYARLMFLRTRRLVLSGWRELPSLFRTVFLFAGLLIGFGTFMTALPWEWNLSFAQTAAASVLGVFLLLSFFGLQKARRRFAWGLPLTVVVAALLPGPSLLRFLIPADPVPPAVVETVVFGVAWLFVFMLSLDVLNMVSKAYTRIFLPFRYGILGRGGWSLRYYHVFAGLGAALTRPRVYAVCRYMCGNDGNRLRRLLAISKHDDARALGKTLPLLAHRLAFVDESKRDGLYERFLALDVDGGVVTAFLKSDLSLDVCVRSLKEGIPLEYAAVLFPEGRMGLVMAA